MPKITNLFSIPQLIPKLAVVKKSKSIKIFALQFSIIPSDLMGDSSYQNSKIRLSVIKPLINPLIKRHENKDNNLPYCFLQSTIIQ